jgi:hypothetical protein
MYASNRDSQARADITSRLSIASSITSVDLHRTSSTSSNHSTSTSASSVGSVSPVEPPKHRKTFSSSSIHVPRRLLRKSAPQESRKRSDSAPTSAPQVKVPPVRPPRPLPPPPAPPVLASAPIAVPAPKTAAEWQCSDLVVRCKNDVYHVDRDVMCYHSHWFARVCAVLKSPVRMPVQVIGLC